MGRDLKKVYTDPKAGPQQMLTVLYLMSVNALKLPTPTADQLAAGEKAAQAVAGIRTDLFHRCEQARGRHGCRVERRPHHDGEGGEGHVDVHRDQARARTP